MKKRLVMVIHIAGIASLTIPVINSILSSQAGRLNDRLLSWVPNIILTTCAWLIRFLVMDTEKTSNDLRQTDLLDDSSCNGKRFINFMFLAMNVGMIATITIYFNFIIGAYIYFVMHILLIIAMSGTVTINPVKLKQNPFLARKTLFIILSVCISVVVIFFTVVWQGVSSAPYTPYVVILACMASLGFTGMIYGKRSLWFRLYLLTGAVLFVISDFFIGMINFDPVTNRFYTYFVNPTYVAAIYFLLYSQLFPIKKLTGSTVPV
jgi:hypothetical protein